MASASVPVAYPWAGRVMGKDAVVGASSTTQAGGDILASSSSGLICMVVKSGTFCVLVSPSQKVSGGDLGWVWVEKRCVLVVAEDEAWTCLLTCKSRGWYRPRVTWGSHGSVL